MMNIIRKLLLLSVASAVTMMFTIETALAEWTPKKPVTFVIMAGPGGGADKMARLMQSIIEKHKLSPKPFVPINKPGGSGAEALLHLKGKKGDDHTVMVTLNSFYTTPMRQPKLGVHPSKDFSAIGRMAEDTFVLWVHKNSGIKTLDQFVKAAKAKGNKWLMAGTGKGQEDQLLTNFLNKKYGLDIKYIPFKGGGRVAKELAGEHVNSTVNNPSEQMGFYEAGDTVPIAAFTDKPLPMIKAPTFTMLGAPYEYYMQRSVAGPPGMSKEAKAYYQKLFAKVYKTPEWQKYMKKKSLRGKFITGDELKAYWKKENDNHRTILKNIGEI